jgi:hypothetical protein
LNPAIFLYLFQARTWNSIALCCGIFVVQWFEMRGGCSLCWPLVLKLLFHYGFSEFIFQYNGPIFIINNWNWYHSCHCISNIYATVFGVKWLHNQTWYKSCVAWSQCNITSRWSIIAPFPESNSTTAQV